MAECAVDLADRWTDGQRIDIKKEMAALTQLIAVRTIFGVDTAADAESIGRAMDIAQKEIGAEFSGIGALLPDWVPTPGRARIKRATAVIDAEVSRVVSRHRDGDTERPDLLSRLLAARDETGARLSDREIRDETVTLTSGATRPPAPPSSGPGTCFPATPGSVTPSPRNSTGSSPTTNRATTTTPPSPTPRPS